MSKRIKFFLSHLAISAIIALIASSIIFFVWYSAPLATAVGVTHIVFMMLAIDVVIGPLFTLLVYKEGKKTLKFDLSVIVIIQIAALCYGIYSIEQGRPAWLIYHVDRFELVRKNDIILENIDQAQPQPQFQHISWVSPQFAAVKLAASAQQRQDDMFTAVLGGVSLAQQPERYVEIEKVKPKIQQYAQDLALLSQYNDKVLVKKILIQYPQANTFVPLKANAVDMTVLVNRDTAQIIKIVDLRPWK